MTLPAMSDPLFWLLLALAAALATALTVALRQWRVAARRARRITALERAVWLRNDEARYLVERRLPMVRTRLWQGQRSGDPGLLHADELNDSSFTATQNTVINAFAELRTDAERRAEQSAQAAVQTVMRSMQALLNEQQRAIIDMIKRHDDHRVLADANAIDHASAQANRRAKIVGLLTGAWPGRQRTDSALLDVVRGAVSNIRDYRRIEIVGEPEATVVSQTVEPVVLALSELLDNAARHSEPGSNVQVWFQRAHNGVSVVIDDSGIGLKPEETAAAGRLLSGDEPVLLTQLRNPPKFGWPAVGVLAARYGFRASVDQESPYGGVRGIIYVPKALLTSSRPTNYDAEQAPPASRSTPEPTGPAEVEPAAPALPTPADAPVPPQYPPVPPTPPKLPTQQTASAYEPSQVSEEPPQATPQTPPHLRADGLPQRRRRQSRQPSTTNSSARPATGFSHTVGAVLRGRRAAQQEATERDAAQQDNEQHGEERTDDA